MRIEATFAHSHRILVVREVGVVGLELEESRLASLDLLFLQLGLLALPIGLEPGVELRVGLCLDDLAKFRFGYVLVDFVGNRLVGVVVKFVGVLRALYVAA
jgi:hypothetical protein